MRIYRRLCTICNISFYCVGNCHKPTVLKSTTNCNCPSCAIHVSENILNYPPDECPRFFRTHIPSDLIPFVVIEEL